VARRYLPSLVGWPWVCIACFGAVDWLNAAPVHHSLWHLKGNQNDLYLLGSVHFLKVTDYPLASPIEQAFSNCPVAVFETDLARMQEPATQARLLEKARLPPGDTIREHLATKTFRSYQNCLHDMGLAGDIFDTLKPSVAALTIESLELEAIGFNPDYAVDQHFYQLAKRAGKELIALESVDFQIDLITGLSPPQSELLMKTTLESLSDTKQQLQQLVQSWRTGDTLGLEKLLLRALAKAPDLRKRMVTDRNRQWLPQIERLARGHRNVMVIVGAGHLVGVEGVVALLRKEGWQVNQE